MSHECPVAGCSISIGDDKIMCVKHWKLVPGLVQKRVYAAWQGGKGRGTEAHRAAKQEAIGYAEAAEMELR